MNSRNFVNGPRWNGVICPKCGEDCFNTWGLIEHMKTYHSNRAPDWSSIFAAFIVIILAVSLFRPVSAQDTQPPSVGEPHDHGRGAICVLAGADSWLSGRLDHAGLVFAQK